MATCCSQRFVLSFPTLLYVHLYLIPDLDKLLFIGRGTALTIDIGVIWLSLLSELPDRVECDGSWRVVHGGFWYELYEAHTTH
jgi:hypothetical protein